METGFKRESRARSLVAAVGLVAAIGSVFLGAPAPAVCLWLALTILAVAK